MTASPHPEWRRRHVLAAALPFLTFGFSGLARATPLNTLETLDLPSPNTTIEDADGGMTSLPEFSPTPLLVNFWASWCPPCIHELPALQNLDQALSAYGMGVLLIGVDRKGRDFGEKFLADRGILISRRAYDPNSTLAREMKIRAMPTSFLLTGQGRLIGKVEGALAWDDAPIVAELRNLLGQNEKTPADKAGKGSQSSWDEIET